MMIRGRRRRPRTGHILRGRGRGPARTRASMTDQPSWWGSGEMLRGAPSGGWSATDQPPGATEFAADRVEEFLDLLDVQAAGEEDVEDGEHDRGRDEDDEIRRS